MCLRFVAQAAAQRQVAAQTIVVLRVERTLDVAVFELRIANAARVAARPAGRIGLETFKGVGAEIVRAVVRFPLRHIDLRAGAEGVIAADVIEVRTQHQRLRMLSAGQLRAAAGEGVEHADGLLLDGRRGDGVIPRILAARAKESATAQRTDLLQADRPVGAVARVGALFLIPLADAEVRVVVGVDVDREAERLVDRQRVIEAEGAVEPGGLLLRGQCFGAGCAVAGRDVDVRRLRAAGVVDEEVVAGLVLDDRAAAVDADVAIRFGPALGNERAAAAEAVADHAVVDAHPERSGAGLRDDLDVDAAGGMKLRRELIARNPDRADLRFRRQRAALKAVDLDHRSRSRHLLQLLPQRVRIVRERLELFARQRGTERRPARIGRRRLLVLADQDGFLVPFDRQHHHLLVVAVAHAHLGNGARLESREFRLQRVAPGRELRDSGDAVLGRFSGRDHRGLVRRIDARHRHRRARQHGARGVDDGDDERAVCGRLLCERRRCREEHEKHRCQAKLHEQLLSRGIKPARIDLRVDAEAIERRLFCRVRPRRATNAVRQLQTIDVFVIREIEALLCSLCTLRTLCCLPRQHDRKSGLGLDEQARAEVRRTFDIDHVGLALRGFGLRHIGVGDGECRRRTREHAEQQPREILLGLHHASAQHHLHLLRRRRRRAGTRRRRHRPRHQHRQIANKACRHRPSILRRKFVATRILVWQFGVNLEFDGN